MLKILRCTVLGTLVLASAAGAHAAWPDDKPVEVLVGFGPGGEADIMARGLAPFISKHLGKQLREHGALAGRSVAAALEAGIALDKVERVAASWPRERGASRVTAAA